MKATITKKGVLEIEATNDIEEYALRAWVKDALLFNDELGKMVVLGEYIRIKGDDDE